MFVRIPYAVVAPASPQSGTRQEPNAARAPPRTLTAVADGVAGGLTSLGCGAPILAPIISHARYFDEATMQ